MQVVWTLLQTGNHASTSPLNFLQAGRSSWRPTNALKASRFIWKNNGGGGISLLLVVLAPVGITATNSLTPEGKTILDLNEATDSGDGGIGWTCKSSAP